MVWKLNFISILTLGTVNYLALMACMLHFIFINVNFGLGGMGLHSMSARFANEWV